MLRVLTCEPVEIGPARAAELVDGLVGVGDHEEVAVPCDERLHQLGLCVVGVLVLVDHHVADAIRDRAAHRRLLADEALRIQDAVVEVKDPGAPVALVEARVDAGHVLMALEDDLLSRVIATLEPCHRPRGVGIRSDQFLFCGADDLEERVHEVVRAQRIPEQRRAEVIEDRLHVKPSLGRVGDAEHRGYPEQPAPLTHHAQPERVVVGERRIVAERSVRAFDTRAHLVRCLARVGEHELPPGPDAGRGQAVKSLHDDSRLAAARAGDHEAGPVIVLDGDALLVVERSG